MSTYMPSWVKTNNKRFPRAKVVVTPGQKPVTRDVASLFNDNTLHADCRAFSELMTHLRDFDSEYGTVIMVQVENECGLREDSRDRSDIAEKAFASVVPAEMVNSLNANWDSLKPALKRVLENRRKDGKLIEGNTWEDTFGSSPQVDELFMAFHYARYIDAVAACGKKEYSLPMYTNAWLPLPTAGVVLGGNEPGIYPSGGPVPSVLDIWQLFAPSLDFLSPDIYLGDYEEVCKEYRHRDQPLFIPEQRRDKFGALRMWSALGNYSALGASPFGIDSDDPKTNPFTVHFGLLAQVAPFLLSARQDGRQTCGFYFDHYDAGSADPSTIKTEIFGKWVLTIRRSMVFGHPGPGYGLIIALAPDEFLFIGEGFRVDFSLADSPSTFTGILIFEEKIVKNGRLVTERLLNGDELGQMPGPDPDFGDFPVAITIPSRTKLAACRPYYLVDE
jgi:hypothetical protein